eukprot:scaffold148_cov341-Pavlova_lutheri.AAC.20
MDYVAVVWSTAIAGTEKRHVFGIRENVIDAVFRVLPGLKPSRSMEGEKGILSLHRPFGITSTDCATWLKQNYTQNPRRGRSSVRWLARPIEDTHGLDTRYFKPLHSP